LVLILLFTGVPSHAQYFGRNKPNYSRHDFKVLETPHFELHHYLTSTDQVNRVAGWLEDWYALHKAVVSDTLPQKNPFVLYNHHGDFRQTNTVFGSIGEGTGGVTEAFKNRVILPFAFTNQQTHHVIGHELVHAFQFNMILSGDSTSLNSLGNLPLWVVEGLAEYMSIGRMDPHTAMWMRDAVARDDIPSFQDLYRSKYFPYRYGQVFWSFLTGTYGDEVIRPFFINTAKTGVQPAMDFMFKTGYDSLNLKWQKTLKEYYTPMIASKPKRIPGGKVFRDKKGNINLSPSLSPNGKYLAFLSEKDVFSIDLYVAELRSGDIIEKLTNRIKDAHLDDIAYVESGGSWSPDSKRFVFTGYRKGRSILIIKEAESGRTRQEIELPEVPAIANPAWSPNGQYIAFTGMKEGQTDLYVYDFRRGTTRQLTDDLYSEIQPSWSADGQYIVFATDENSIRNGKTNGRWTFQPAIMDFVSGSAEIIDIFPGANSLNPIFDHEGQILFLSDRDGYRNLYRYDPTGKRIYMLTDLATGISGITPYSPAITASQNRDKVIYTVYQDGEYQFYQSKITNLEYEEVDPLSVDLTPAILPIRNPEVTDVVNANLEKIDRVSTTDPSTYKTKEYRPKLRLDHIFSSGIGVGLGTGTLGAQAGLAGGVNLLFSDMLGDHNLYTGLSLNGEIIDVGAVVSYINKKGRLPWGINISHVPFRTGSFSAGFGDIIIDGVPSTVYIEQTDILRIFEQQASIFGQYPLNRTQRFELGGGINYRFFRYDIYRDYFDPVSFIFLGQDRERIPIDDDIRLGGARIRQAVFYTLNAAWVGDNSFFGMASPLEGYRWRVSVDQFMGGVNLLTTNADFRAYKWLKPVALAARFQHYAQHSDDLLDAFPVLVGNGQLGLIRGFDYSHLDENRERYDLSFLDLSGSKFFVTSFEVRLPFTGPQAIALLPSGGFFSEFAFFVDAGVAFDDYDQIGTTGDDPNAKSSPIVASTGISLRVNLFGALIVEPYYAWPIQSGSRPVFGFNLVPGW
jgi:Tol biopolymer transport system component